MCMTNHDSEFRFEVHEGFEAASVLLRVRVERALAPRLPGWWGGAEVRAEGQSDNPWTIRARRNALESGMTCSVHPPHPSVLVRGGGNGAERGTSCGAICSALRFVVITKQHSCFGRHGDAHEVAWPRGAP